jgi:hypothetical protein
MTAADVKQAYEDLNGAEAAQEVDMRTYEAAAHYGRMNDYDRPEDAVEALDVLRVLKDGEFAAYGF